MAINGYVLAGIVLVFCCQPFSVVSYDKQFRLQHDFNNIYYPEESNIAVKHRTHDTLTGRGVVKYPSRDTLTGRGVVKYPSRDTLTGRGVVKYPSRDTLTGRGVVKYPSRDTLKGRGVVKYPSRDTLTGRSVVKYPTHDTLTGRSVVKHPSRDTLKGSYKPVFKLCGDDKCLCSKVDANCINQGRNLTYIPKLPKTIKNLNFSYNYLPYLDNTTVSNLTSLYLTEIEIGGNMLTYCGSNAFENLTHLTKLVIWHEKLESESLKRCFASISSKFLYKLYLFGIKFTHGFKSDLFSEMKNSSVRKLNMDGSNIKIYNQSAFSPFTQLERLDLCRCQLSDVIVDYAPKLKWLTLENNFLFEIPDFCENGGGLYPWMASLSLDYNKISSIPGQRLECLNFLRNLSLSNNNIITIEPNTFSRIPKLKVIFLEFNNHKRMVIKAHAFNSSSLTRIFLQGNNGYLDNRQLSFDAFKDCPNLKVLNLQETKLQYNGIKSSDAALHRLLGSLSNLEELNLDRTQILALPSVIPQRMPKLQKLFAHTNLISQLPKDYFCNLTHLKKLDLKENRITVIRKTSFSEENLRSFEFLGFEDNPFLCNCDLLWFLNYIKTGNNWRKFQYWPNYYCVSPPEFQDVKLNKVPLDDHICLEKQISAPIIHVTATLLTLIFFISCLYRYRWKLRYLVYMIRFQQIRYQRMNENDGYLYDLYLSSSEDDFDFILEHIVPKLENELELRLYIPQRDGMGYKVDAIVTNMDVSKKALLFVSDSYIQDQYCQLEATIALDRYVSTRRNMMIVVLLNELPAMNKTIHKILNIDEYIMWSDGEENERLFWRKLKNSIQSNDDLRC